MKKQRLEIEIVSVVIILAVVILLIVIGIVGHLGNKNNKTSHAVQKPSVTPASIRANPVSTSGYLDIKQLGISVPLTASIQDTTYKWNASNRSAELSSTYLLQENNQENPPNCKLTSTSTHGPTPPFVYATIVNKADTGGKTGFAAAGQPGGPINTVKIKGQQYYLYSTDHCPTPSTAFNYQIQPYMSTMSAKFSSTTSN